MSSKEVLLISDKDLTTTGGSQESVKNILSFLGDENCNVQWTYISPFTLPKEIEVKSEIVTNQVKLPFTRQYLPTLTDIKKINQEIELINPDAIVLNHPGTYAISIFHALPQKFKEKSFALWRGIVGNNHISDTSSHSLKLKHFLHGKIAANFYKQVKANLGVSLAVCDSLIKAGAPPSSVIPVVEQVGGEYSPELRIKYGKNFRNKFLSSNEMGVLVASRIAPNKGIEWLTELYSNLRHNFKYSNSDSVFNKIKISIAGSALNIHTGYEKYFKDKINQVTQKTENINRSDSVNIELLGEQSRNQLQSLYNSHDLLFMPSPEEGFGRVTVEALSGGCCVIGREGCLATEEILLRPPYSVGTVCNSIEEVTREIFYLTSNHLVLKSLQDNSAKWANNHYCLAEAEQSLWKAINL